MADESTKTTEVLVLTDDAGELYAIPSEALQRYKVSGEQKARIEKELDQDDVSGFLHHLLSGTNVKAMQPREAYAPKLLEADPVEHVLPVPELRTRKGIIAGPHVVGSVVKLNWAALGSHAPLAE